MSLFILALLSSAGIFSRANAAIIYENGNIDLSASNAFPTGGATASLSQEWYGADVGGIPEAFDQVSFWFKGNTVDQYNLQLYRNYGCSNHSGALVDSTGNFYPTSTDYQNYTLTFSLENTTATKYCYSLYWEDVGGTDDNRTYISPLNTKAGMNFEAYPGPQTTSSQPFAQFCNGLCEPALVPSFVFFLPEASSSYAATYHQTSFMWSDVPNTSYENIHINIELSTSSDFSDPFTSESLYGTTGDLFGAAGRLNSIPWTLSDFQSSFIDPDLGTTSTLIYIRETLIGANIASSTTLATDEATFYMVPVFGGITSTLICDPSDNIVVFGMCRLFMPSKGDLDQFKNLAPYAATKMPFGMAAAIQTAENTFASSTPTSTLWIIVDAAQTQSPIVNIIGWGTDIVLSAGYFFWLIRRFQNVNA